MGLDLTRERWRTLAASVAGTSHARAGEPCADASAVRVLEGRGGESLLVAVAADGAGTSPRAREGARLACDAIVSEARKWAVERPRRSGRSGRRKGSAGPRDLRSFAREDVVHFVEQARARLVAAARREAQNARDFSCTLLTALVDARSAVFFQIGDGAIVYQAQDGHYVPALWPQSGEYANCTFFLTDADAAERVQAARARSVHELALFTDGLQGLALQLVNRAAHGPFFEPMFARLRGASAARPRGLRGELQSFLDSKAVNQRTDDDKTLVLATRLPANGAGTHGPRS
jgi:hypothetical protein